MESFAPSVVVDGITVQPEGWMWILGFALGGCEWAIQLADSPEFDLRGKINDYDRRKRIASCKKTIEYYEKELARVRSTLRTLKES